MAGVDGDMYPARHHGRQGDDGTGGAVLDQRCYDVGSAQLGQASREAVGPIQHIAEGQPQLSIVDAHAIWRPLRGTLDHGDPAITFQRGSYRGVVSPVRAAEIKRDRSPG